MNTDQASEEIVIIRTLDCDLCQRFDSILLSRSKIEERVKSNHLNIGSHIVNHGDHLRIAYFDIFGAYLGDTISLSVMQAPLQDIVSNIPSFVAEPELSLFSKFQKRMLELLVTNKYEVAIVGPSMVGKTSLSLYLETGIPERYTKRVTHSPTMGRSVKRIKLGNSHLKVFDMGGQKDFWDQWKPVIQQAEKIVFIIDGTANNTKDMIDALDLVLEDRSPSSDILILMNKMDLVIDGYTSEFINFNQIERELQGKDLGNLWKLKTSIYNGIAYNYVRDEETSLAEVIYNFLNK